MSTVTDMPLPREAPRPTVLLAVAAACVVLPMVLLAVGPFSHNRGQRALLGLAGCAVAALLRRWPLPVLAAATLAVTLVVGASGEGLLALNFVLAVAAYGAASRLPRRVAIGAGLGAGFVISLALLRALATVRGAPVSFDAVEVYLPLAAGWMVGDAVAARRRYLAGLAEQAAREAAAESARARLEVREERVRIARELHDVVAHTLAVITIQAGVGRRLMERRPDKALAALASIEEIGRTAQGELHVVLDLLRDEAAEPGRLVPAPRLVDVKELVDNVVASGTAVELRVMGTDQPLSPAIELSVYRLVQEALTNVVKHAPGARATVEVAFGRDEVRVQVADTGPAAATANSGNEGQDAGGAGTRTRPGSGHGLVGMRERVSAFGGSLTTGPLPGGGYGVDARLPLVDAT